MKKTIAILLSLSLLVSLGSGVMAIKKGKIVKAPKAPEVNSVIVVKAKNVKAENVKVEKKTCSTGDWVAKGGLMGGAGAVALGYSMPNCMLRSAVYVGYGVGNNFTSTLAQWQGKYDLGNGDLGYSLDFVNYSVPVKAIPGLSDMTDAGSHLGVGVSYIKDCGAYNAEIGYSTALGIIGTVGYRF